MEFTQETIDALSVNEVEIMKKIAEEGGKVLFVGTKKQAQEAAEECAVRTNNYFVTERLLKN